MNNIRLERRRRHKRIALILMGGIIVSFAVAVVDVHSHDVPRAHSSPPRLSASEWGSKMSAVIVQGESVMHQVATSAAKSDLSGLGNKSVAVLSLSETVFELTNTPVSSLNKAASKWADTLIRLSSNMVDCSMSALGELPSSTVHNSTTTTVNVCVPKVKLAAKVADSAMSVVKSTATKYSSN